FDCFVAAGQVGPEGRVVGVDMTDEMLERSRAAATALGLGHVEFRKGIIEELPVENGWAYAVISNGVINLCADKRRVFNEVMRVLCPGGRLQFADMPPARLYRKRPSATSICGPTELPVACRVQLAASVGRKRVRPGQYRSAS